MTILELYFPLQSEMMTTVRLAAGGVCALMGLNIDESEDCKVCVTESLLLLKHRGYSHARLSFTEDEGLYIRAEGEGEGIEEPCAEDEISLALLGALLGEVETEKKGDRLFSLAFRFGKVL